MNGTMSREYKADELRTALNQYGFVPLIKSDLVGEIWSRGSRKVVIWYEGDFPERAIVQKMIGAYAIDRETHIELSFD